MAVACRLGGAGGDLVPQIVLEPERRAGRIGQVVAETLATNPGSSALLCKYFWLGCLAM